MERLQSRETNGCLNIRRVQLPLDWYIAITQTFKSKVNANTQIIKGTQSAQSAFWDDYN